MAKYKLEYIWLDGYEPVPNLRGKTQIKEFGSFPKLQELPMWGFDGSSTRQAEGHSSDCMLKPVAVFPDTTKKNGALSPPCASKISGEACGGTGSRSLAANSATASPWKIAASGNLRPNCFSILAFSSTASSE